VPLADVPTSGTELSTVFPANSITLLVIPPAASSGPKPKVAAVTNAASYSSSVSAGAMVLVWGSGLGPQTAALLQQDGNGLVSTSVSGVRVLFDGVPAPLVYVSPGQCSAIVPYFGALKSTTHVQVEYHGVRSDPLEITVLSTAPALFSSDFSGVGQGAILNEDGVTRNSSSTPAAAGSVVILWGTGEGLTDPPGVDGRPAVEVLPKPVAPVSVEIGGVAASIEYAGAAPGSIPGLFQINVRIPQEVQRGDRVPIHVKIGTGSSQQGVTVAIR